MKNIIKTQEGITLVSLVITIIVMLILAGVSLSMVTGDSSVLKQAQKTAFLQEISAYKEELELEISGEASAYYVANRKKFNRETVTAGGANMKRYIQSMKEEDYNKYMIVEGEIYYIGDDDFILSVCEEQNINTRPEGVSVEDFADEVEERAMEAIVKEMAGIKSTGLGVPLATKTSTSGFGNANDSWRVITELDANGALVATYADGWYFVEKNTEVPDIGKIKYDYIINYTTRKAVRFDGKKHNIIASDGSLAVTDGLAYNADPTNMDGSSGSWGDAKLNGFTGTVTDGSGKVISGWTNTAFITDGENDYVSLKGDKTYENGVTIEFYGRIPTVKQNPVSGNPGRIHLFAKGIGYSNAVVLGWWNSSQAFWFGYGGHRFWHANESLIDNKDIYVALRANQDNPEGVIKLNNNDLPYSHSSGFNWDKLVANLNKTDNEFIFGRGIDASGEGYTALEIYTIRVYNRFLSEEELTANYNASIAYHQIAVSGGNAGNNNTGGSDFGEIE